jgi:hypothetical protein
MTTRLLLRPPWFVSTPLILAAALVLAAGLNILAGVYFQREFRDDADPLLSALIPESAVGRDAAPGAGQRSSGGEVAGQSGAALPIMAAAAPSATSGPVLISEGEFVDGDPGHHGEGRARLIRAVDDSFILRLEDFSVTNGPDVFVVLSTDPRGSRGSATAGDAVNLGRLKATDGNINYAVPDGADVSGHRSVIIYCRAFNVVFAVATLEAQ